MTVDLPLVQIYFSPQPSTAIKIKEGGHNFRYEITEHSLAKITPALQATRVNPLGTFSRQLLVLELDFHVFPYFVYIAHFTIDTWKSLLMEKSKAEESPWRKKGNKKRKQAQRRKKEYQKFLCESDWFSRAPRWRPDFEQRSRRQTKIYQT